MGAVSLAERTGRRLQQLRHENLLKRRRQVVLPDRLRHRGRNASRGWQNSVEVRQGGEGCGCVIRHFPHVVRIDFGTAGVRARTRRKPGGSGVWRLGLSVAKAMREVGCEVERVQEQELYRVQ